MNNIGDSGSPSLSPCWCTIFSLGEPLSRTCVEEVARRPLMTSRQIGSKPIFCNTSSKKAKKQCQKPWWCRALAEVMPAFVGAETLLYVVLAWNYQGWTFNEFLKPLFHIKQVEHTVVCDSWWSMILYQVSISIRVTKVNICCWKIGQYMLMKNHHWGLNGTTIQEENEW